jgi:hypothetical protein
VRGSPGSRLFLLPLVLFVALGAVHVWTEGDQGIGIDYFQFWAVGQAVRERLVEDIYGPEAWGPLAGIFMERARSDGARRHLAAATFRREEIQTSNTPFLYAAVYAIESGDYERDIARFRLLGLLLAVASIGALCRSAGWPLAATLMAIGYAVWAFAPLRDDLREGNVNSIQLACLALFVVMIRSGGPAWREILAGAILGAGTAFKPNLLFVPLALIVAWALQRRFDVLIRRTAGMAAGGLLGVAAGGLFFGSLAPWLAWADSARKIQETFGSEVRWGSFGGARLLLDATGSNLSPLLYLFTIGAVGFAAWRLGAGLREGSGGGPAGRAAASGSPFGADCCILGLGALVPLLSADLAWPHYLVQAIPLVIWLLRPAASAGLAGAMAIAGLAAISSSPVVDWLASGSDYAYALPLAGGCLALFSAGLIAAARGNGVAIGAEG